MKILVLNCGSSSIKYKLMDMDKAEALAQGGIEKIGLSGSFLKLTLPDGNKVVLEREITEHQTGIRFILDVIVSKEYGCIKSLSEIDAVGHRVVHGGEKFSESQLITSEVIRKIVECIDLAPLHNPPNLSGIEGIREILPNVPQAAVFDTAFHQSMPDYAYMYALPYSLYEKYAVRRYGFHGTSHRYVSRRACEFLGVDYYKQRIITCHIGNGASIAAIAYGKTVDTSMGMTPVEGLMMGTRCGDVDAGVLTYLMEKEQLDAQGVAELINKQSGVQGITGISSDMREVSAAAESGNRRAKLALQMYDYRIKKYVGAYTAVLGGCDILVFTGGVGENQWKTRKSVCEGLEYMGVKFDNSRNDGVRGIETIISADHSAVKAVVIPTDEELLIAQDTLSLL
ncbi:MAG: acetate kinase [Dysgonamonadaceae bacterium]|jgi:acetate kinase|nr:acetate kinase [Dysgonamonadaceae bacterium]